MAIAVVLLPVAVHLVAALLPGFGSYVVLSGSMEPTIPAGSLVFIADTGHYEPGDVITYTNDGTVVTHRVVSETADGLRTKGDANGDTDPYTVARTNVRGEVVLSVARYGGVLGTVATYRFLAVAGIGGLLVVVGIRLLVDEASSR